jgi:hypothetical protein
VTLRSVVALFALVVLVGCGGAGSESTPPPPRPIQTSPFLPRLGGGVIRWSRARLDSSRPRKLSTGGFGIIKGGIDAAASTDHLSA